MPPFLGQERTRDLGAMLGQGVLIGDSRLIVYGALLWVSFHLFVVAYDEPTLEHTFGSEYEAFPGSAQPSRGGCRG